MRIKNDTRQSGDRRVERLTEDFGKGTVFVPVAKGGKNPMVKGFTNFTLEKMADAEYCRKLEDGNVAILVGPNSGNLISIDFDDEKAFEEFARLNPELCKTLQSFGARGRNLWFRMGGEYIAAIKKLKNGKDEEVGEWRGGGGITIVDGVHPEGVDYRVDASFPIKEISAEEISWPEEWQKHPGKRDPSEIIAERYGPPYMQGASGGVQLNESFVAGWIACEVEMKYAKEFQRFFQYSTEEGIWVPLSTQQVDAIISRYLSRLARESGKEGLHFKKRKSILGSIRSQLEAELFSRVVKPDKWDGWRLVAAANTSIAVVVPTTSLVSTICPVMGFNPCFHLLGKSEVSYEEGTQCP